MSPLNAANDLNHPLPTDNQSTQDLPGASASSAASFQDDPCEQVAMQVAVLREEHPCPHCDETFRTDTPMLATPVDDEADRYTVAMTHAGGLHTIDVPMHRLKFRIDCIGEPTAPPARAAAVSVTRRPLLLSAKDLLSDPDCLAATRAIYNPWAYPGHITIVVAKPKDMKSTLAGWIATVVSRGDRPEAQHGRVLWVSREEPGRMVLARLVSMGADLRNLKFNLQSQASSPLEELRQMALSYRPGLIVIDALAAYLPPEIDENSAPVGAFLRDLVGIARESGAAILLLHHARKADGLTRGHSAIEAAADQVVYLKAASGDGLLRDIEGRGRFGQPRQQLRFDPSRMCWEQVKLTSDDEGGVNVPSSRHGTDHEGNVRRFLTEHPGAPRTEVVEGAGGRSTQVRKTLDSMVESGAVEVRDKRYYLA